MELESRSGAGSGALGSALSAELREDGEGGPGGQGHSLGLQLPAREGPCTLVVKAALA